MAGFFRRGTSGANGVFAPGEQAASVPNANGGGIGQHGQLGSTVTFKTVTSSSSIYITPIGAETVVAGRATTVVGQHGQLGLCFTTASATAVQTNAEGQHGTLGECATVSDSNEEATTSVEGQHGTLGECATTPGTLQASNSLGQHGTLGDSSSIKGGLAVGIGQHGTLGTCSVVAQITSIGNIDVEQIMDAVIDHDALGNPITLRSAFQAMLSVMAGASAGFPGTGQKTYKSVDGTKDRVKATTDQDGNRQTNPEFDFTEVP